MKFRVGTFGFLLILAVLAVSPLFVFGEDRVYTVERGETLYSIARELGVKLEDLMRYNGITDPARLRAGQQLKIPDEGAHTPANAVQYTNYRVLKGDTLFGISRRFSVSVPAILTANSLAEDYVLREGDSLRIPSPQGTAPQSQTASVPSVELPRVVADPRETQTRTVDTSVRWPVLARELSYMTGKLSGVVITGVRAESVKSLTTGIVLSAGPYRGFGKVVIVQVDGGYLYVYGGLDDLSVKEGDTIAPGTEVGKLGVDVVSNKPHLFFMVYKSNVPVDPAKAPRA